MYCILKTIFEITAITALPLQIVLSLIICTKYVETVASAELKLATCGIVFLVTINMYMRNTFCIICRNTFCNAACFPTTTKISSEPDQCDLLEVQNDDEDDGTCCAYQETHCNNGKVKYTLVLCYFTSPNVPCCKPFFQDNNKERKSCFLVNENSQKLTQTEGSNIVFSICDSLASSTDTDHQKTDHSLDTTSAAGSPPATNLLLHQPSSITTPSSKNTHPTPPNHSNSLLLSPSTLKHNNPSTSTAMIWGLVVGAVIILFVASILLLAAVSVIIAAKKGKYNVWIMCKESIF